MLKASLKATGMQVRTDTWLAVRRVTGSRPSRRVWFQFIGEDFSRQFAGVSGGAHGSDADRPRNVHAGVGAVELDAAGGVQGEFPLAEHDQGWDILDLTPVDRYAAQKPTSWFRLLHDRCGPPRL
ncbi:MULTISPECIES: hypothetical protein [Streptomyces]|uniref:Uncharacterized protein n=1 Tax=Streptomyces mirabilis TaxID=68239 RepID=A0ABU3UGZ2_9ACTN|nr:MULTISPECIES: hypothetical protein [Streptomyces]MCX4613102.1 hypothetical protein [Streptomyces mirabilis]MCX5353233.1 hypothetical protein [Streptomyces mirabilis]MDU8993193.1 hypothetical protein [Streptomyces mirabilis]QDN81407.1 hypothetical protein FNV64_42850 [Streptomyces sp. S1A1-7]QDN91248.1 hypothetical protein FNV61_42095 [Streptomyces sp. RLB3-6]